MLTCSHELAKILMKDHLDLFFIPNTLICASICQCDLNSPGEDEYSVNEFCMEGFLGQENERPE